MVAYQELFCVLLQHVITHLHTNDKKKGSIVCVVTLLANSISHDKDKGKEKKRFNKQVGRGGGGTPDFK